MPDTARNLPWLLAVVALAVTLVACGGDDDDGAPAATFGGQPIDCAAMNTDSHRYLTSIHYDVDAGPTPIPEGVVPAPPPFELTQSVAADVATEDTYQALYTYEDEFNHSETDWIRVGDSSWQKAAEGWRPNAAGGADIPYRAVSFCEALAPDIDPAADPHESEEINGIPSERFDYEDWASDWASRSGDFGGGSDVGSLIETWSGSVWVAAEGNYISKVNLTGTGQYPDGSTISFTLSYEVKDRGANIQIDAPS